MPEQDTPTHTRPERPTTNELRQTFTQVISRHVGADLYIDTVMPAAELATHLERLAEGTPFKLTMMSNRGTQVWPSGSIFTDCVDYWRVRFEVRDPATKGSFSQGPLIALLSKIAEKFLITDFQPLKEFDGKPGYSLAQGQ